MDTVVINSVPLKYLVLMAVWTLPWKGLALWHSARLSHKRWFIVLLIVNTMAILDIYYIYFVANKYTVETIETK